jgi:plastocyanin
VNPEKESKFTVTFTKKGTVKFQCDYHLPDMAGEIVVK